MEKSANYRPEIDGLRAIAILSVLCFHLGIRCPGGYVGVDVFFVISGYLISSIIFRDLESGCFSLVAFWERRFRRIIPALSVVVITTLVAGSIFLLPNAYSDLGSSAIFQALFAANFYFHRDTGYFASQADQKPLLHTWSLAVEEQFYLVVPILMMCMFSCKLLRNSRTFLLAFILIAILSFLLCLFIVDNDQLTAFFLLPSRAWELLFGTLIALVPTQRLPTPKWWREITGIIGLFCIIIPIFYYDRNTTFPGITALPPVLGSALTIISNLRTDSTPLTLSGRILSSKPMVGIGLISYSLYLWHWPLVAFANYWSFSPITREFKLVLVIASFLLAFCSWKFVELPFRRKFVCASQRAMFAFTGIFIAFIICSGTIIKSFDKFSFDTPIIFALSKPGSVHNNLMSNKQVTRDDIVSDRVINLGKTEGNDGITALLWGDSHAMAAYPAFDNVFKEFGICARAIMHSGTAPLVNFRAKVPNGTAIDTVAFNEATINWLKQKKVKHVFLVGYWQVYETKGSLYSNDKEAINETFEEYYKSSLLNTVKTLISMGCIPWILLQVPEHSFDVPKAYAFCRYFGGDRKQFLTEPDSWNGLAGNDSAFLVSLTKEGAQIVNTRPAFLDQTKRYYEFSKETTVYYGDKHHLSVQGAERVLGSALKLSLLNSELLPIRKN